MKKTYPPEFLQLIKTIGENIQKIRAEKNISLELLSEKTGISKKYLKKIETGKAIGIKTSHFILIAEALSVQGSSLLL